MFSERRPRAQVAERLDRGAIPSGRVRRNVHFHVLTSGRRRWDQIKRGGLVRSAALRGAAAPVIEILRRAKGFGGHVGEGGTDGGGDRAVLRWGCLRRCSEVREDCVVVGRAPHEDVHMRQIWYRAVSRCVDEREGGSIGCHAQGAKDLVARFCGELVPGRAYPGDEVRRIVGRIIWKRVGEHHRTPLRVRWDPLEPAAQVVHCGQAQAAEVFDVGFECCDDCGRASRP